MRVLLCGFALSLSCSAQAYTCSVSATPLMFGTVPGVAGQARSSTATVTVTCEADASAASVSYSLYLDQDGNLSSGDGMAQYQLFSASDRQPLLANRPFASANFTLAARESVTRTYTLHGRMQPARDGAPGVYQALGAVRLVY